MLLYAAIDGYWDSYTATVRRLIVWPATMWLQTAIDDNWDSYTATVGRLIVWLATMWLYAVAEGYRNYLGSDTATEYMMQLENK